MDQDAEGNRGERNKGEAGQVRDRQAKNAPVYLRAISAALKDLRQSLSEREAVEHEFQTGAAFGELGRKPLQPALAGRDAETCQRRNPEQACVDQPRAAGAIVKRGDERDQAGDCKGIALHDAHRAGFDVFDGLQDQAEANQAEAEQGDCGKPQAGGGTDKQGKWVHCSSQE